MTAKGKQLFGFILFPHLRAVRDEFMQIGCATISRQSLVCSLRDHCPKLREWKSSNFCHFSCFLALLQHKAIPRRVMHVRPFIHGKKAFLNLNIHFSSLLVSRNGQAQLEQRVQASALKQSSRTYSTSRRPNTSILTSPPTLLTTLSTQRAFTGKPGFFFV